MGLITFPKPPNIRYTQMAMYIDEHIPDIAVPGENTEVESLVYQYLYHLYFALSCKLHYFKNMRDYDGYALYAAAQTYMTLRDRWQHQGEKKGDKTIVPIKSSLNYVKTLLYPFKVNYQQAEFMTVINPEENPKQDTTEMDYYLRESVQADYNWGMTEAFLARVDEIPGIVKRIIMTTPYRKNPGMVRKLYISCLLSFISSITLSKGALNAISRSSDETTTLIKQLDINGRRPESIVLWHLDKSFTDYIKVLLARIKKTVDTDFANVKHLFELKETTIDDILNSAYATYDTKNEPGDH